MSNYKIRVNSKSESKEAQELFFELGFQWKYNNLGKKTFYCKEDVFLYAIDGVLGTGTAGQLDFFNKHQAKEITLPQLRDLVVLNRNDRKDATHGNPMYPYIKLSDGWYYFDESGKWLKSTGGEQPYYDNLKPITKEEGMKEYLDPENNYRFNVTDKPFFDWIEIPDGAEIYIDLGFRNHSFYKDNFKLCWCGVSWENTVHNSMNLEHWNNTPVLWKRHTHPEELPFIDDETSQSLNDQYAEIETVRQTLNQRQSQYGSFEDVAMITEQMIDVMRKGYYENLAYNQKMALYMICSKMARIVNGNPNHKDSWHDIAGYATLIDSELVSEKDMPF